MTERDANPIIKLDSLAIDEARVQAIDYIKNLADGLGQDRTFAHAAYDIAGLMASDYVQSLADDDPIMEICTIAGELEISPRDHTELRRELINRIGQL